MMRYVLLILTIAHGLLSGLALPEDKKYTTKYDNVDIDAVINNDRLLNTYIGCLLERNPCSPDATELKKNLPEALATDCEACSEAQKKIADKFSHHLIDNKPNEWQLLEEKYDPTGDYKKRYLDEKSSSEQTT